MPLILNLDTSTQVCSVVLASEGEVLGKRESHEDRSHSKLLSVFILELLTEHNLETGKLDAIAVSKGPGSYTGLRIGVSTAKGIAYGSNIPLIGIGTLDALAYGAIQNKELSNLIDENENVMICPMIDARRMEVYTAKYDTSGEKLEEVSARIIDENSYSSELKNNKVVFLGDGSSKCRNEITSPNAIFIDNIFTSASNMTKLAESACKQNKFEDIAYFEPFYLKDFIATIPKNKIFSGPPLEHRPHKG